MRAPKIKVIIADQSQVFRTALAEFLTQNKIEVIGEAGNNKDLLKLLQHQFPDVLIYDEFSYDTRFKEVAKHLFATAPGLKILFVSLDNSDAQINFYHEQGAYGYCDKIMADYNHLIKALKSVSSGKKFFPAHAI